MNDASKTLSGSVLGMFDFPNSEIVATKLQASRDRINRSFSELFSGYGKRAEDVLNETTRVENYSGIVTMRDIHFYTFCEHHFLPFFGIADVAYQPKSIITGLGKLIRLVNDVHARRLQIQELMTRDIADDLMRVLDAHGAMVITRARHLCTCSRGPRDDNAWTEVIYGTGSLPAPSAPVVFGDRHRNPSPAAW
jgi:GTP cyclohydrolase I